MSIKIAETFYVSIERLSVEDQRDARVTVLDIIRNLKSPGLKLHRVKNSKDKNFWSVNVGQHVRIIVHQIADSFLICYVDRHDPAYAWAESRSLDHHPDGQGVVFVKACERVQTVSLSLPVSSDFAMLQTELKNEAGNISIDLPVCLPQIATSPVNEKFTEQPSERFDSKFGISLTPEQEKIVYGSFDGHVMIDCQDAKSRTNVAVLRAIYQVSKNPNLHLLLTSTLGSCMFALKTKIETYRSRGPEFLKQIYVKPLNEVACEMYETSFGPASLASRETQLGLIKSAAKSVFGKDTNQSFLCSEWFDVVDAWQVDSLDSYEASLRVGRNYKVPRKHPHNLWKVFESVRSEMQAKELTTYSQIFRKISEISPMLFDVAVVDDAHDITGAQLRFLAALSGGKPDSLFLAGNMKLNHAQRVFPWESQGVDCHGRYFTLKGN